MKKLLKYLAANITGEKPKISKETQDELEIYSIRVPKDSMGMMIGKGGKIIRAVRTLAKTRAIVDQKAIAIKLEEGD